MATSLGPRWPSPFVVKITRNIQEESLPIFHAERHPLGFRRYELRLFGRAIRLHYWPANCQPGEDRHTHQYPFVSVPLLGRFADTRYVEVPGDEWQKHTCQTGTKTAARSMREAPGRSGLRPVGRYVRRPLRPYRCASSAIHWHRPVGKGRHASLVFVGRTLAKPSDVYRRVKDHPAQVGHNSQAKSREVAGS
jgi:hypothetical protein